MEKNMPQGDPLVSIRCLVYNHEPFLRQCLDGFVMQETTFPFEAIVHDDASTDGSAAIIREYAEKYPHIIKPIYETENQWGKYTINKTMAAAIHPSAKYIATCEGDDYWTDPHKLQIQVDFLESHPDYVMSSHDFSTFDENKSAIKYNGHPLYQNLAYDEMFKDYAFRTFDLDDSFRFRFAATLACVYRKGDYIDEEARRKIPYFYDFVLFYFILKNGKCALFKKNMATYRVHKGGIYSGGNPEVGNEKCLRSLYGLYGLYKEKRWFPKINRHFVDLFCYLAKRRKIRKLLKITLRHVRKVPIDSSLTCFKMIISKTFEKVFV